MWRASSSGSTRPSGKCRSANSSARQATSFSRLRAGAGVVVIMKRGGINYRGLPGPKRGADDRGLNVENEPLLKGDDVTEIGESALHLGKCNRFRQVVLVGRDDCLI